MSDSTCTQLANSADGLLEKMDSMMGTVDGTYNDFTSSMSSLFSTFLNTGTIDVDSIISEIDNAAGTSLSSVYNSIKDYTGSCLDAILDPIINGINDVLALGTSIIGDITGMISDLASSLISGIFSLTGIGSLLDGLGITSLIASLDQMLGCLASASCLPIGKIESMLSKVTSFTSRYGLTSSGSFSFSSWMNNVITNIQNIPTNLVNAFQNGIAKLSTTFTNWVTNFQTKITSMFTNIASGITGLATGVLGGLGGIANFFGDGTKSTPGKNATPIKTGKCDAWDKDKQLNKIQLKITPEGSKSIWS